MRPVELLAPAGDLEKCKTALYFGADAVYAGGPAFNLRAGSANFTMAELNEAVQYAHARGKKLYVTVNVFARNADFASFPAYIRALDAMGVDAVLVSDLGFLSAARQAAPALEIHISTQANCLNYMAARTYHDLGAKRVVLARECTLEEIAHIRAHIPDTLELEAFVHGAMCMAYSGRCLISSFLTGRDSNRGDCAQACRWNYTLMEEKRPGEYFPIHEDANGTTLLSSYDLNLIDHLDALRHAGLDSLKIEGRMKSAGYVATVTNAYRKALDGEPDLALLRRELNSVSHREFSTGFYFDELRLHPASRGVYLQDCVFAAIVRQSAAGQALVEQKNKFSLGDTLEILSPGSLGLSFTLEQMWDAETGLPLQSAPHPAQRVRIACPYPLHEMDILRKRLQRHD